MKVQRKNNAMIRNVIGSFKRYAAENAISEELVKSKLRASGYTDEEILIVVTNAGSRQMIPVDVHVILGLTSEDPRPNATIKMVGVQKLYEYMS